MPGTVLGKQDRYGPCSNAFLWNSGKPFPLMIPPRPPLVKPPAHENSGHVSHLWERFQMGPDEVWSQILSTGETAAED